MNLTGTISAFICTFKLSLAAIIAHYASKTLNVFTAITRAISPIYLAQVGKCLYN